MTMNPFCVFTFITLAIAVVIIKHLAIEVKKLKLAMAVRAKENLRFRMDLQKKVQERIEMTESWKVRGNDMVASYIYKQDAVRQLGEDLYSLHAKEYNTLRTTYPELTELDLLVMSLLALDMDNYEICSLLHMEKRTLYRRRQLIGQRLGLSSTELERFAQMSLGDNAGDKWTEQESVTC